jgi:trk system potassium uptake protein TrkA
MDLGLPKGILIALISRNGDMFVPWGNNVLQEGDEILIFSSEELMNQAVEILGVG